MAENKIQIVSEYTDLATAKIKSSFAEQEAAADRLTQAIDRMSANMAKAMDASAEKTISAVKGIGTSLKNTKAPVDEQIGGMVRMAKAYEHVRIEIARLRNAVLIFTFLFRPTINLIKDSVNAYMEQEDAINRVNAALRIQGTFSVQTSARLTELASSLQEVTRYGDEAISGVIQKLISQGDVLPSQLEATTKAVLDFSAATGRDLGTSADVVSKAMAGFTGQLSRYGIFIDRSIPSTEKATRVLEALNKQFGGFAQKDVQTLSGRIAQFKNTLDELNASMGQWIVKSTNADKVIKDLNTGLKFLNTKDEGTKFDVLNKELSELDHELDRMRKKRENKFFVETFWDLNPLKQSYDWVVANSGAYDKLIQKRSMLKGQLDTAIQSDIKNAISSRKSTEIGTSIGSEQAFADAQKFNEKFIELSDKNKILQQNRLEEEYRGYADLVKRRVQIEKGLNDQLAILMSQRTDIVNDDLEASIASIEQQKRTLEEFYSHSNELGEQHTEEWAALWGRSIDPIYEWVQAGTRALDDGFFKIITGKFRDLEDVVIDFGNTMLKVLTQMATNRLISSIMGAFNPFGGYSFGSVASTGTSLSSQVGAFGGGIAAFHRGGYVRAGASTGSGYAGDSGGLPYAGRYHSGGEVMAIMRDGEGVLNRNAMKNIGVDNLNKLNAGGDMGGGGVVNNYYIQTIDERSFRERLGQNGDIFSSAVETNIKGNRSARKTIQRFGT